MLHIFINGASGKMGNAILELSLKDDAISVVTEKSSKEIDVVIDFSRPESLINNLQEFKTTNIPFVIGTTGFSDEQIKLIENESLARPILLSFNMSKGIFTLKNSIKKFLQDNMYKLECNIEEIHHISKVDAPSGTAIEIKNLIKKHDLAKNILSINIDSKRIGDVFGIHKVSFKNDINEVEFKHEALSRDVFAEGAIEIAKKILKKDPGLYQLEDFFENK
ncbi:4-hydroxy-tetrahydrodipicolinate reductase [Gammaproteobacteria bacterium]|nr:4-hydroxy-tetrahydrodipicolinate reductase [Gammaproteobacteria bacterium]MDA7789028.1 4-hydroxy-tetrahydrodipicolinate reductase [Gammaproteobacteria bacterium]